MPITPHANGEPLLKQSSDILSQFATIVLVVWSANGKVVLLLPRLVPIFILMILTDVFVR